MLNASFSKRPSSAAFAYFGRWVRAVATVPLEAVFQPEGFPTGTVRLEKLNVGPDETALVDPRINGPV